MTPSHIKADAERMIELFYPKKTYADVDSLLKSKDREEAITNAIKCVQEKIESARRFNGCDGYVEFVYEQTQVLTYLKSLL